MQCIHHIIHSSLRTAPRSFLSTRSRLLYIPQKVKEEMAQLHEEDSKRWTATTLAARYTAPRENVEAWLGLMKLRDRGGMGKGGEKAEKLEKLKEEMVKAWQGLGEGVIRGEDVVVAAPSKIEEGKSEKEGKDAKDGEEELDEDVEGELSELEVEKSRTAKWVEQLCEKAGRDVSRKTTFAFIEVGEGVKEGVERAVWMREGKSGVLRLAKRKEREVLLNEVRSVDKSVWE